MAHAFNSFMLIYMHKSYRSSCVNAEKKEPKISLNLCPTFSTPHNRPIAVGIGRNRRTAGFGESYKNCQILTDIRREAVSDAARGSDERFV